MPPGIPTATVGVNASLNAAILAMEMIALGDEEMHRKVSDYKATLGKKIEKANEDLASISDYEYKTN
jgi:5-(carboxyamino)imidazole ribonucleotide mutase